MKVIVAGSRHISDWTAVETAMNQSPFTITEVVSGCAPGVDSIAASLAEVVGVKVQPFPANWDDLEAPGAVIKYSKFGKPYNSKAGPDRNRRMAEYADALIAVWDGKSSGTHNMIVEMQKLNKPVHVVEYKG